MPPSDQSILPAVKLFLQCFTAFVLCVALSGSFTGVIKVLKHAFIARMSNEIGSSQPDAIKEEWKRLYGYDALEHVVAAYKASSEIVDGHLMEGLCYIGELAVRLQSHHAEH